MKFLFLGNILPEHKFKPENFDGVEMNSLKGPDCTRTSIFYSIVHDLRKIVMEFFEKYEIFNAMVG